MVNRDILKTSKALLSELDKQRLFLLRVESTPMPCPACKTPVDAITAAGIDLDDYDFGTTTYSYRCPSCRAELDQIVPAFPASASIWLWQLKDSWLQQQLKKAKAFDQQPKAKESTDPT